MKVITSGEKITLLNVLNYGMLSMCKPNQLIVSGLESLLWISHLDIISQPFCPELSFCPCSDQGKADVCGTSCLLSIECHPAEA